MKSRAPLLVLCLLFAAAPASADPIEVHAHRGGTVVNGRAVFAEETLPAYRRVAREGYVLEIDAKLTKDGVPVAIHDATLDRTTNCTGEVRSYTLAALEGCRPDVLGSPGSPLPTRQVAARGSIATIAEVLRLARETGAGVNLEIKNVPTDPDWDTTPAYANRVMDVVVASRLPRSQLLIQSFIAANLDVAKRRMPRAATSLLTLGSGTDAIDSAKASGYDWVSPQWPLTAAYVSRAHRLGRLVAPYTLDAAADVRAAGRLGVDAVITDDPSMAARALGLHQVRRMTATFARRGARVRLAGALRPPGGLPKRTACRGSVTLLLLSRTRTLTTSHVKVRRRGRGCAFAGSLRIPRGARGAGRLRATARFEGNAVLLPHALGPLRVGR